MSDQQHESASPAPPRAAMTQPEPGASTVAANAPTNAQLKAQKKAEKQAKRASAKSAAQAAEGAPSSAAQQASARAKGSQKNVGETAKDRPQRAAAPPPPPAGQSPRTRRESAADRNLPLRRRPSHSGPPPKQETESKQVSFLGHVYGHAHRQTLDGAPKEVHPAILALTLQLSSYVISGSHARGVAMLLALKSVIESYTTPLGTSLPRHLSSHHLSPQLSHVRSGRPFAVTQSNAVRWLKNYIANIDPAVPEIKAKADICSAIDDFVRERFTAADQLIAEAAAQQIKDGDVVLTFAKSAAVEAALALASKRGTRFHAIIVDARPMQEGKNLARALARLDLDLSYCALTGLSRAAQAATKCLLGAHAVLGNGCIYSRVGTAMVALAAKENRVPVYVCAESIKFTDRVSLDGLVMNELAPEDELLDPAAGGNARSAGAGARESSGPGSGSGAAVPAAAAVGGGAAAAGAAGRSSSTANEWRSKEHLQLLNMMYDVTPAENVAMVITELGNLPPSSAPAVQRIFAGS